MQLPSCQKAAHKSRFFKPLRHQNKMKRLSEVYCGVMSQNSKLLVQREEEESFGHRNSKEQMIDSCIVPIVKHGGSSAMVWGCFAEKNNNKIIKDNMISSGNRLISKKFIFRHDNYPKHCSNLCKD